MNTFSVTMFCGKTIDKLSERADRKNIDTVNKMQIRHRNAGERFGVFILSREMPKISFIILEDEERREWD